MFGILLAALYDPISTAAVLRPVDFVIGPVEEVLQFPPGEGPLAGRGLCFLGMGGGVPVKAHLGRVGAEKPFADPVPAILRGAGIGAEGSQRRLVAAHR